MNLFIKFLGKEVFGVGVIVKREMQSGAGGVVALGSWKWSVKVKWVVWFLVVKFLAGFEKFHYFGLDLFLV